MFPDPLRTVGHGLIERFPELEAPLVKVWYVYVYLRVRAVGLWNSFVHEAPIDPFQIYWVDPARIQRQRSLYSSSESRYKYFGRVVGGDWDRNLDSFEETDVYRSFEAHFRRGVDWEETPFFHRTVEEIAAGQSPWRCESKPEFVQRCEGLDELYRQIETRGYRTQEELSTVDREPLDRGRYSIVHRLLYDEITVNIGRNGEAIFNDGRHRLAIAKLLDLEEVPVRIVVRHARWQRLRDAVTAGDISPDDLEEDLRTHPDLRGLWPASERTGRGC